MNIRDLINGISEDVEEKCVVDKDPLYCFKEGDAYLCLYSNNKDRNKMRCKHMGRFPVRVQSEYLSEGIYYQCWYHITSKGSV